MVTEKHFFKSVGTLLVHVPCLGCGGGLTVDGGQVFLYHREETCHLLRTSGRAAPRGRTLYSIDFGRVFTAICTLLSINRGEMEQVY